MVHKMAARLPSLPLGGEPELPNIASSGARAAGLNSQRFEIDDDDLDELADIIPCSSPYFMQPTQIIDQATQPTQIVERRTTLQRSSPPVPETPTSIVEVPASSPFRSMSPRASHSLNQNQLSAIKTQPHGAKTGGLGTRGLASLMAPAGTAFRAPFAPQPQRAQTVFKGPLLNTSDDDLAKYYKREDSSGDETPMRGDIRPSSFVRKQQSVAGSGASLQNAADLMDKGFALNDINDLRLRYLTRETHKIAKKVLPQVTILECKNALVRNARSTEDAVKDLLGKLGDPSGLIETLMRPALSKSRAIVGDKSREPKITIPSDPPITLSSPLSSQASPEVQKAAPPPRRRLVQGRRNRSPSPAQVFSVSPSHSSAATTPSSSTEIISRQRERASKMAAAAGTRRRLVPGRPKPESCEVITLDSESDEELPDLNTIASRKRKAKEQPKEIVKAPINVPSDSDNEPRVDFINSDDSGSDSGAQPSQRKIDEQVSVLDYLNKCSAEELARMTGLPTGDTQLVLSERQSQPFKSLEAVTQITGRQKSKTKAAKIQIGLTIVEKLVTWFNAFDAVTNIIKECEQRGAELESVMSTWEVDKNGKVKDINPAALVRLPITKQPTLMDASVVQMKSYQLLGLNWLNLLHGKGYSGILADDMGLGKTCQVISFIAHLVESRDDYSDQPWPNLIVVPPSTLENWVNEFERFAPGIKVFLYSGTNRRELDPEDARDSHVVLTSYSQMEQKIEDIQWLTEMEPYAAIFDEGHKLKNPNTKVYKHLMKLPSSWRLVLSGTPVQNNLKELLSLLHFVEPDLFHEDDFEKLRTIFEAKVTNKDVHNFAALAKERVGNARTIMAPFILQRRKDDVLDLAKKIENVVLVGMHPDQRAVYSEIKGTYLTKSKGAKVKANSWMQLRKAAIHHQLFRQHFTDRKVKEMTDILWSKCSAEELDVQSKEPKHKSMFQSYLMEMSDFALHLYCKDFNRYLSKFDIPHRSWEESPKVQKLLELVKGYMANGDRCLVFSRFEMVIDILRETLHCASIPYCELTGRAGVADRFPEIQRFNEHPEIPVFLLTTGAGGTGLNLTAANKIIIFDQSDNPQDDVQASNRAHRIGQTRDVEVIRIITENTVETLVYNSCVKKLMLAACVEGQFRVDDDHESVEEECRKKMLETTEAEIRATQVITVE
ncbi:SNF2 family N-terminal domain-containing protein [Pseudomassariella vexata]|uniref:SNF2 family N-terminal domain-domain-containing protein n=1 Tax=Pseudomassariella vexata TaxID=1141098 RepID=A0A1Y2E5Q0_9PEZI|nr:SNF2 family N-terminal domain-containing protein [Pseudomassariella vexata]ORY66195.1 SNF2 family N-terminal domain-domain-containing protein [Pseudomassariella vexata]